MQKNTRIYLRDLLKTVESTKKSRLYFYYLKLRAENNCKGFFSIQQAKASFNLSEPTTYSTIKDLINAGYIQKIKSNSNLCYKFVSNRKYISIDGVKCHEAYYSLNKVSLKCMSLSSFKALLVELVIQQNRNYRVKSRIIKQKQSKKKAKTPQAISELDNKMAYSYVSKLANISVRTVSKYRKLQTVTKYSKRCIEIVDKSDSPKTTKFEDVFRCKRFGYGFMYEDHVSNIMKFVKISERDNSNIKFHVDCLKKTKKKNSPLENKEIFNGFLTNSISSIIDSGYYHL